MERDSEQANAMRERLKVRYEAIGRRNEVLERDARRDRWRILLKGALLGWAFCVLGLLCIGVALNSTSEETGYVWFWGGLALGNGGMLFTFIRTMARYNEPNE